MSIKHLLHKCNLGSIRKILRGGLRSQCIKHMEVELALVVFSDIDDFYRGKMIPHKKKHTLSMYHILTSVVHVMYIILVYIIM